MTTTGSNSQLSARSFIAERVCQQLQVFPKKFRELGEGGELENILNSPSQLTGPRIHQAPEDFTEQYLIEPVLHSLGYLNPISDKYEGNGPHFVRRPTTFRNLEIKRPDYKLKNLSDDSVCILEAKAANKERPGTVKEAATDDMRAYVESNTFAKYLKSRDQRYLVGIGTDGLRWGLWAKDVRTGETKDRIQQASLVDTLREIGKDENVISGEPHSTRAEIRRELADSFVPFFSARELPEYVRNLFVQ